MCEFLTFLKDVLSSPVTLALAGVVIGALLSTWGGLWQLKLKLREERQWQIDTTRIQKIEELHVDLQRFQGALSTSWIAKTECMMGRTPIGDVEEFIRSSIKYDYDPCRIEMTVSIYAPELKAAYSAYDSDIRAVNAAWIEFTKSKIQRVAAEGAQESVQRFISLQQSAEKQSANLTTKVSILAQSLMAKRQ